ncbi:MAG: phage portal protein [bacterium]|nr:phage portal protein [bacterium]
MEFIRAGGDSVASVTVEQAMRNPAVFRSVSLISYAVGMLPVHVIDAETKEKQQDSHLFKVLHRRPNNWQTAFNFRQLMQRRALCKGNGYAHIVRGFKNRIVRLVPLDPDKVEPRQRNDFSVEYVFTRKDGNKVTLPPEDVLHIYGDSDDGIVGTPLVKVAAQAITLALQAEHAAERMFKNGVMVGGALTHPKALSPDSRNFIRESLEQRFTGSDNAHKWLILEEGMKAEPFSHTSKDSQQLETRQYQVEEIGRVFGIPRPLLGVDETNWGTGVGVLGQFFVRYGLNPWFTAWEQAAERSLMTDVEREQLAVKFNPGALIRGSMSDQAEFFSKALGSGGHQPWMDYSEVRELQDLPDREIPPNPMTQPSMEAPDEPAQPS